MAGADRTGELAPFRGTGTLLGQEVGISFLVIGGFGAVQTRHAVLNGTGERWDDDSTWFATGVRPALGVGVGGRLRIGRFVSVRLELTDTVSTSGADTAQGCDFGDLEAMDQAQRGGRPTVTAGVRASCDAEFFSQNPVQVPTAMALVRTPDPSIMHVLGVQLGAAVVF